MRSPAAGAASAREIVRCSWAGSDPLYRAYHDEEWGIPLHDDRRLFEMLVLEGAQAGLSWITILRKRDAYRRAFAGFDPARVARFDRRAVARLMRDEGIVRNRLKIEGAVRNARAYLAIQKEFGSFDRWLWAWVKGRPIVNRPAKGSSIPASTDLSSAISRDLRRRGMTFVGPTILYAFLQATGVVDDHAADCFASRRKSRSAFRGATR